MDWHTGGVGVGVRGGGSGRGLDIAEFCITDLDTRDHFKLKKNATLFYRQINMILKADLPKVNVTVK